MSQENQKENELLDLQQLLVKLEAIKTTLEHAINVEDLEKPIISLQTTLRRRQDYYFLFTGGRATSFRFVAEDISNLCSRLLALCHEAVSTELVMQEKSNLLKSLEGLVGTVKEDLRYKPILDFQLMKHWSPPRWRRAPLYFVSYAHKDLVVKDMLFRLIYKVGHDIKIWVDEIDLKRFHEIPEELSRAMKKSKAAILFFSRKYFESKWCNEEWQALFMRRLRGKPALRLYLVRIDDFPADRWPPLLQPYRYTDCRNYPSPSAIVELGKLARDIEDYEMESWRKRVRAKSRRLRPKN